MKPNSNNEDRISKYLSMLNKGMLFDELSEQYLEKSGLNEILSGVPVPVTPDENGELSTLTIALNMARVIGGDTAYPYADKYISYLKKITENDPLPILLSEGAKCADAGDVETACMYFRAALAIDRQSADALFLYGRACKEAYEREDLDEEYVGSFKAESLEAFELLTMIHPEYDMGYYFLGYGYANLGLYTKAKLTWDSFMELSHDPELREEINDRLTALTEPVIIEQGCNKILSGDFAGGKDILEPFMEGRYEQWWPLWFYLGVAEESLGDPETAISRFKKALVYSPSNIQIMEDLVSLYNALGDEENAEKYSKKIEIVRNNMAMEQN